MLFADFDLAQRLDRKETDSIRNIIVGLQKANPDLGIAGLSLDSGAFAAFTTADMPINRAVSLGMNGPVIASELDHIEEFYRERQMPSEIDICPLADASLVVLTAERGYQLKRFLHFLYRPITSADITVTIPTNISITEVSTSEDAAEWVKASSYGFSSTTFTLTEENTRLNRGNVARSDARLFLAKVNGELAGSALLSIKDGVAGFASTSTIAEFRGYGVQTALIQHRLAIAAQAGCDLALVLTTPGSGSQRNVERAGFRIAYTTATLWKHFN